MNQRWLCQGRSGEISNDPHLPRSLAGRRPAPHATLVPASGRKTEADVSDESAILVGRQAFVGGRDSLRAPGTISTRRLF